MTVSLNVISRYIRRCSAATKILDLKFSKGFAQQSILTRKCTFPLYSKMRCLSVLAYLFGTLIYYRTELCKSAESEYTVTRTANEVFGDKCIKHPEIRYL